MFDSKANTLLAVVQTGSYTKAAAKLNLTQPAVSHHISQLEQELGVRLFVRGNGDLMLTPEGETVLRYVRRMKALEKKKEGEGSYGRPRARLPEDFREQVLYHQEHKIPLENYRRKTTLKKATFYKYVKTIQSEREEAGKKQERYQTIS